MRCPRCSARVFLLEDELLCHNCGTMPLPAEQQRIEALRQENARMAGDTRRFRGGVFKASVVECGMSTLGRWGTMTDDEYAEMTLRDSTEQFTVTRLGRWECLIPTVRHTDTASS